VVLPWVPATTMRFLSRIKNVLSAAVMDMYGMPSCSRAAASGLVRLMTFPTTTRSGLGSRLAGEYPSLIGMPMSRRKSLIGG